MIGTASNKAAIVHSQNIHTNCYCRNSLLVWCHQFNFFAHKMVGCSIWKMICTTAIRGSGALTPPTLMNRGSCIYVAMTTQSPATLSLFRSARNAAESPVCLGPPRHLPPRCFQLDHSLQMRVVGDPRLSQWSLVCMSFLYHPLPYRR